MTEFVPNKIGDREPPAKEEDPVKTATLEDLLARAADAIAREEAVALDVAVEHGQIFGNVARTAWFRDAVARQLAADTKKYAHLQDAI